MKKCMYVCVCVERMNEERKCGKFERSSQRNGDQGQKSNDAVSIKSVAKRKEGIGSARCCSGGQMALGLRAGHSKICLVTVTWF